MAPLTCQLLATAQAQPRCFQTRRPQRRALVVCSSAAPQPSRREALQGAAGALGGFLLARAAPALAFEEEHKLLCEESCLKDLDGIPRVKTASGLEYQDIVVGTGPSPITSFQVVCNYVAMTPQGKIFDSSLDRGTLYEFRYGTGSVIPGLDEGLSTMKVGGLRRLYIPGDLAFPNGVPAAAGRARVPPLSPVVFDVQLLLIPGLDDEE